MIKKQSILILAPLLAELKALMVFLKTRDMEIQEKPLGRLKSYEVPRLNWVLAVGGLGKAQFAVQTQYMIHQFPAAKAVICAGSAASLRSHLAANDIIVANTTIEHDYRTNFDNMSLPSFPGDSRLLESVSKIQPKGFALHIGAIASGDENIIDQQRAMAIREGTGAIAVAWEGAGAARASQFNNKPFLEVRGITDAANDQALKDFTANLQKSMANLGDVLLLMDI